MDDQRRARLQMALARKGMAINEALTRALAGQNIRLDSIKLPHEEKPGERPHEKLRRYLDTVVRAQRRLGTEAYGRCVECGVDLAEAALDEMPWLESCATCETRG